ncbi:MAG: septum formation protein Maf [Nitriliruptoraceae bacterium]|nr:septum formation protein Maf [Nitriliruptoraceae bacterium]
MGTNDERRPPTLVLASASPRRAALLARIGLTPLVEPAGIDETPRPDEPPAELVRRLAATKAAVVADRLAAAADPSASEDAPIVLAADTMVVLAGQALGQPADRAEAAAMLWALSGRIHEVMTAVAVRRGPHVHQTLVTTRVHVRTLDDPMVAWYLDTGEPFDKAGGYGLQGAGAALITAVHGSDTAVIGLPLAETVDLLTHVGLDACRLPLVAP